MNCPKCKNDTKVIDSRPTGQEKSPGCKKIRRRRECLKCGFRFTTIEITQDSLDVEVQAKLNKEVSSIKRTVRALQDRLDRILEVNRKGW